MSAQPDLSSSMISTHLCRWQLEPQAVSAAALQSLWAWLDAQLVSLRRQSSRFTRLSTEGDESIGSMQLSPGAQLTVLFE
jgi:hypothetical protein